MAPIWPQNGREMPQITHLTASDSVLTMFFGLCAAESRKAFSSPPARSGQACPPPPPPKPKARAPAPAPGQPRPGSTNVRSWVSGSFCASGGPEDGYSYRQGPVKNRRCRFTDSHRSLAPPPSTSPPSPPMGTSHLSVYFFLGIYSFPS
jgi:hypothetical protein